MDPFGLLDEVVNQGLLDEEEEGYIEFNDRGNGDIHFWYVHGSMDSRPTTRDGDPAVE